LAAFELEADGARGGEGEGGPAVGGVGEEVGGCGARAGALEAEPAAEVALAVAEGAVDLGGEGAEAVGGEGGAEGGGAEAPGLVAIPVDVVRVKLAQEVEAGAAAVVEGDVEAGALARGLGEASAGAGHVVGEEGQAEGPDHDDAAALVVEDLGVPPGEAARGVEDGGGRRAARVVEADHGCAFGG
jgi:hypothetical protein